jgi:hypothetical protein
LSYRRAEELFCAASGGWTLHQLRHSAITHLAEADVGVALLMAKSRHTSLRSLGRYARPGPETGKSPTMIIQRPRRGILPLDRRRRPPATRRPEGPAYRWLVTQADGSSGRPA